MAVVMVAAMSAPAIPEPEVELRSTVAVMPPAMAVVHLLETQPAGLDDERGYR